MSRTVAEVVRDPTWRAYRAWLKWWADAWGAESAHQQARLLMRWLTRDEP